MRGLIAISFTLLLMLPAVGQADPRYAPMGDGWFDSMLEEIGKIYGDDTPRVIVGVAGGSDGGGSSGSGGSSVDGGRSGPPNPQDPEVASLIREWLNTAIPEDNAKGGRLYYDPYGRFLGISSSGTIIRAAGPPSPLSGPTPEAHAWVVSRGLGSLNLCTMEEFVTLRLANSSLAHCKVGVPGPPSAVAETPSEPSGQTPPASGPPAPAPAPPPPPPVLTAAEKCDRDVKGSAPLDLGGGVTVCACPQGQKIDKASKSCVGGSSGGVNVASQTREQKCQSKLPGSVPKSVGNLYVCRCPSDKTEQNGRCVPKPSPANTQTGGMTKFRAGTYSCTGGWDEVVLTQSGPGYARGYYTGTYDKSARGSVEFGYNPGANNWVGKWGEPNIGRKGFLRVTAVSGTRIAGRWDVYSGSEGVYQGRKLRKNSDSFICNWKSGGGASSSNSPSLQGGAPQTAPGVSGGAPGEERVDKSRKAYYVVRKRGKGWRKRFGGYGDYSDGYHLFILEYDPKGTSVGGNSLYTWIGGHKTISSVFRDWQTGAKEGSGTSCKGEIPLCPCRPGPDIYLDGPHYEIIAGPYNKSGEARKAYECEKKDRGIICNRWNTQSFAGGYRKVVDACRKLGH